MALTVSELLAEPQLGLTLIAGSSGTANQIVWAHTSDLPRLWEWVTGGELMMTNGLSIPPDPPGQVELAEGLVSAGASALAIGERMHAPELTPEFLAACDALALPVISIPYPLPFIAISHVVAESSLLEESRRLRQIARIYDLLRRLGEAEDGWLRLTAAVERELDAELFVVDARCGHPWHPEGLPLPAGVFAGIEGFLDEHSGHTPTYQWRGVGGKDVLIMNVPTHENAVLVVLPASEQRPDAVVLLHAASVLGLELSRTVLGLESTRRLGAEFLLQAFEGHIGTAEIEDRLSGLGVRAGEFVVVSMESPGTPDLASVHLDLWRHGIGNASVRLGGRVSAVLPVGSTDDQVLHVLPEGTFAGVSRPHKPAGLQRALQESLWALGTAHGMGERIVRYAEGPSWLGLTSIEEGQALVDRFLGPIIEYEQGREPDLLNTLKAYLECQRSWQKTAETLFVHRQTIIYRIKKISELTGLDMSETSAVAQLWFALQIREALSTRGPAKSSSGS